MVPAGPQNAQIPDAGHLEYITAIVDAGFVQSGATKLYRTYNAVANSTGKANPTRIGESGESAGQRMGKAVIC